MKMMSLFDGSGGFPLAASMCGIEPIYASEVEPYPIAVTKSRFPNMIHLGDVAKVNGAELEPVDIITFGSPCQDLSVAGKREGLDGQRSGLFMEAIRIIKEMRNATSGMGADRIRPRYAVWENVCFTEGAFVACSDGYKKISDICVGDRVKTLSGAYMPVARTYKFKNKEVVRLTVSGGEDLTVTPNHPIWARRKRIVDSKKTFDDPKWVPAGELSDNYMVSYKVDEPTLPNDFIKKSEAWAIGRWIADGSVDLKKSNPRIFISCGLNKAENTKKMLNRLPYDVYENHPHKTAINFCFTSRDFYSLIKDCGVGAANKRVPQYVFELPVKLQKEVLDGYLSGDGYIRQRYIGKEISASTASRELAYGIARLIRNVHHVGVNISVRTPRQTKINGRILNANYPSYDVTATVGGKYSQSFYEDGLVWQPVRLVEQLNKKMTVYNLSVIGDNTYGANDIMGHNCGAFSSNKGEDFRIVLEEFIKVKFPNATLPAPDGKWPYADIIVADGFSLAYRVLDAQYWGVPQRRKRIYLVADFGGGRAPEILLEP